MAMSPTRTGRIAISHGSSVPSTPLKTADRKKGCSINKDDTPLGPFEVLLLGTQSSPPRRGLRSNDGCINDKNANYLTLKLET